MKLSTGKVAFPIEFDNGDKEVIYFNPSDPDLMTRLNSLKGNIEGRIKDLGDVELANDGTPVEETQIEAFENMKNIFKEELDFAFGGKISAGVFKHCSPFAIVEGDYFVVRFIEAITPEIEKHIKKAHSAVEKKMQKHIAKYSK